MRSFLSPDDIRIKGHRIGIDNVLDYYLEGYAAMLRERRWI